MKHDNAFKQPCYHALPLERIVVSFPLSLFLQPRLNWPFSAVLTPDIYMVKGRVTVKEEV